MILQQTSTLMQANIRQLPAGNPGLIFDMLPAALAQVPFHRNAACITRYFAEDFPVHLAIHEISPVSAPPAEYTDPHLHEDFDEINILISSSRLVYKIVLGADEYTVASNSSIWIPRGMLHSANVLEGSGFYIAMRLPAGNPGNEDRAASRN
jgi:hypothetical protein